jgi:hypothetical protein
MSETIEGRAYLYNFDFLKFRDRAEETIRPVNVFHCQGVCWKFRYSGWIHLYINGRLIISLSTDHFPNSASEVNAFPLAMPLRMNVDDAVCVEVMDIQPRWFRWFRPNTAYVTLEGLEECP